MFCAGVCLYLCLRLVFVVFRFVVFASVVAWFVVFAKLMFMLARWLYLFVCFRCLCCRLWFAFGFVLFNIALVLWVVFVVELFVNCGLLVWMFDFVWFYGAAFGICFGLLCWCSDCFMLFCLCCDVRFELFGYYYLFLVGQCYCLRLVDCCLFRLGWV